MAPAACSSARKILCWIARCLARSLSKKELPLPRLDPTVHIPRFAAREPGQHGGRAAATQHRQPEPEGMTLARTKGLAGEFLTIVVGVLTALGVDAWYGGVRDREVGAEYRLRIAQELRAALAYLEEMDRMATRASD